jgi:hypothetical protein
MLRHLSLQAGANSMILHRLFTLGTRFAVRRYLRVLPRLLRRDYGSGGPYTPGQVTQTLARHKVGSQAFRPYALAIFCDADELTRFVNANGLREDFRARRQDVADWYFGGDFGFTSSEVERRAESESRHEHGYGGGHGHESGHHGGHDGSGGHH